MAMDLREPQVLGRALSLGLGRPLARVTEAEIGRATHHQQRGGRAAQPAPHEQAKRDPTSDALERVLDDKVAELVELLAPGVFGLLKHVVTGKLFGGGHAYMRLTDEENSAESGIDVVASPPGKKLQNVLLLSGGEKAMTALALLVGIFQYQPSPFCILDEVDAPLDEANIGRFTELVKEMAVQTQFVLITHSKKTMSIAPVLYGVTMQEPGVSKLVSVRFGATA